MITKADKGNPTATESDCPNKTTAVFNNHLNTSTVNERKILKTLGKTDKMQKN